MSNDPLILRQVKRRRLIEGYAQATDPTERARFLGELEATFTPDEVQAGWARVRDWASGLPPAELEASAEYARYTQLLPLMLAGRGDPGSPDYAWFRDFILRWDSCFEEYEDLRQAQEAATSAQSQASADPIWSGDIGHRLETQPATRVTELRASFRARVRPLRVAEELRPVAGVADAGGEWKDLLSDVLGPDPALGLPDAVRLLVRAQRTTAATCRIVVSLGGPGVQGRREGIAVSLHRPGAADRHALTDAAGSVRFANVAIADLAAWTLVVRLPPAPEPDLP